MTPKYLPDSDAPMTLTAPEVLTLEGVLSRSFFLGTLWTDSLNIDMDRSGIPNASTLNGRLKLSGLFAEETNLLNAPIAAPLDDRRPESSLRVRLPQGFSAKKLKKGEGELDYSIATTFATLKADCRAPGAIEKSEGVELRVVDCRNDFIRYNVKGAKPAASRFRDDKGRMLQVMDEARAEVFPEGRHLWELKLDPLPASPADLLKGESTDYFVKAAGKIASIELYITWHEQKGKASIAIFGEPKDDSDPALDHARHMEIVPLHFEKLTAEQASNGIELASSRGKAVFGYNTPEVEARFKKGPANGLFARRKFSDVKALDEMGAPVPFKKSEGANTYWLEMPEGQDAAAPAVARITGHVTVDYPMEVLTVASGEPERPDLPITVKAEGMSVEVSADGAFLDAAALTGSFLPAYAEMPRAYSRDGRLLRRLSGGRFHSVNNRKCETTRFWGRVARAELVVATRWAVVDADFDVPAAPLRKKEDVGTDGSYSPLLYPMAKLKNVRIAERTVGGKESHAKASLTIPGDWLDRDLYEAIGQAYAKRGLKEEDVMTVLHQLKQGLDVLSPEQQRQALRKTLQGLS